MDGNIDLNRLSLSPTVLQPSQRPNPPQRVRVRGRFLKGPVPMSWLSAAARLPGKTLHVALALMFLQGLKRSTTIKLGASVLELFGVERKAGYSALKRLERQGLVRVSRGTGRNPVVMILEIEEA